MVNEIAFTSADALASAHRTLQTEIAELQHLDARLDERFAQAVALLLGNKGRVAVTGIGKSGHIARKISATFASTGSPSYFVHAAEAAHGDLGMITGDDIIIAVSYSGSSPELATILPIARRLGSKIIGICGNRYSELASLSDVFLDVGVTREACPLNLAPTSSTTVTLALGDALAIACLEARGFGTSDFARSHPGGALGRRLLTHVRDVMRQGEELPIVGPDTPMQKVLEEMTGKRMGMTVIADQTRKPLGIFTDGDLRRLIMQKGDIRPTTAGQVMTPHPRTIGPDALAAEAAAVMEQQKLSTMLVVNQEQTLVGALHMHDLMDAKVI